MPTSIALTGRQSRPVWGAWTVLSVALVGYVVLNVLYAGALAPAPFGFLVVTPLVLWIAVVAVGGVLFAIWTGRPVVALGGAFLVGIAGLSPHLGCSGVACDGVERFRVFVEWTWLGPAVSASTAPPPCTRICPHTIAVVPLVVGYLLLGTAITARSE